MTDDDRPTCTLCGSVLHTTPLCPENDPDFDRGFNDPPEEE